jgi:endonuclease-8
VRAADETASGRRRVRQNTDTEPGAVPRDESFYVYQRDGQPCRVCRTEVARAEMAGRNLFWCPSCQRDDRR